MTILDSDSFNKWICNNIDYLSPITAFSHGRLINSQVPVSYWLNISLLKDKYNSNETFNQ